MIAVCFLVQGLSAKAHLHVQDKLANFDPESMRTGEFTIEPPHMDTIIRWATQRDHHVVCARVAAVHR